MDFKFSFGWMAVGLLITLAGALIVVFHQQIANTLAHGVSSYDHVKLFGVIMVIVGLLVTSNLHTFVLSLITNLLFSGAK